MAAGNATHPRSNSLLLKVMIVADTLLFWASKTLDIEIWAEVLALRPPLNPFIRGGLNSQTPT